MEEFCSTNIDLQVDMPLYFTKELNGKQVRNLSHDQLLALYFGKIIFLNNYVVFVTGKIKGIKKILRMQILYYEKEPLIGRHIIRYANGKTIAVDSLTTFRKSFGFDDLFNFSRTAFIVDTENNVALRLSHIKQFISLPHMYTQQFYYPPLYYPIRAKKVLVQSGENIEDKFCDTMIQVVNDFIKVCPQFTLSSVLSNMVMKTIGETTRTVPYSIDDMDTLNYSDECVWPEHGSCAET